MRDNELPCHQDGLPIHLTRKDVTIKLGKTLQVLLQSKFVEAQGLHADMSKTVEVCTEACAFGTTDGAAPFAHAIWDQSVSKEVLNSSVLLLDECHVDDACCTNDDDESSDCDSDDEDNVDYDDLENAEMTLAIKVNGEERLF